MESGDRSEEKRLMSVPTEFIAIFLNVDIDGFNRFHTARKSTLKLPVSQLCIKQKRQYIMTK